MKKSFNRLAIAGAVSAAVGIAGMPAAQADALMFPYVVTSTTVTTIMSVVSHNSAITLGMQPQLHYEHYRKTVEDNDYKCVQNNFLVPTSDEDLITFDVGGHFGEPYNVLFEDDQDIARDDYGDKDLGKWEDVPSRGFWLVDNGTTSDGEMYGEAMVYEVANGAMWGYRAYNSTDGGGSGIVLFGNDQEVQGEVIRSGGPGDAPLVFGPLDEFVTTFLVTPTSSINQRSGLIAVAISLDVDDPEFLDNQVAFDRDEEPYSSHQPVDVVCVGRIDIKSLIDATHWDQNELGRGGWSRLEVRPPTLTKTPTADGGLAVEPGDGAIVFKLEYNAPGVTTFNNEGISGVVNTANWLRWDDGKGGIESF